MEKILEKIGNLVFIDKDKGTARIEGFRKTFRASAEQLQKIAPYFGAAVKIKYRTISANTCEIVNVSLISDNSNDCAFNQCLSNTSPGCGAHIQTSLFDKC